MCTVALAASAQQQDSNELEVVTSAEL